MFSSSAATIPSPPTRNAKLHVFPRLTAVRSSDDTRPTKAMSTKPIAMIPTWTKTTGSARANWARASSRQADMRAGYAPATGNRSWKPAAGELR